MNEQQFEPGFIPKENLPKEGDLRGQRLVGGKEKEFNEEDLKKAEEALNNLVTEKGKKTVADRIAKIKEYLSKK
jgi:hypothetical protein